jgi:hypothetical protein
VQWYRVKPRARRPVPKGDVIGGTGEFGREGVKQGAPAGGVAGLVIHEGLQRSPPET